MGTADLPAKAANTAAWPKAPAGSWTAATTWAVLLLLACCQVPASAFYRSGMRSSCPDFSSYTALHWGTQWGNRDARYLVTQCDTGLSDRLVNLVSAFYIALITQRALCVVALERQGLDTVYDTPFIDWTCPGNFWQETGNVVEQNTLPDGDLGRTHTKYYREFVLSDLRDLPSNASSTWRIWIIKGLSVGLFHNLAHSQELLNMGLRPDTAFGCALAYLLRPNRSTLWLAPRPLLATMTDDKIIKIGVQLRTGDHVISAEQAVHGPHHPPPPPPPASRHLLSAAAPHVDPGAIMEDAVFDRIAEPFFSCAQQLEDDIREYTGAVRVVWFLMTDSVGLRAKALQRYGADKVLLLNSTIIQLFSAQSAEGFRHMALEHWLMQQAHYFVVTARSGVGRTAAFASLRPASLYTLDLHQNSFSSHGGKSQRMHGRGCGIRDYDSVHEVYFEWSGI
mmetsp:Transcript_33918/g.75222  ORF Transcript_33918/g.75222 Transcript_33918/m.75222 type:complete len:451 (-) Transcript_33918:244-1596(-)|eukprot:CAMPEP_0202894218 /NCGR_PEP_ID=MMETSP1392-20130828/3663_1 /ASSEMBLY_ACC=CAM_ASM_000868 /TAXON_ID=225041 /ORGANISM="Chlamydomonas chlamydogama, Strain SAG 11-48b" /LENGTH=450 /DNA_ID=CAMNT_0049578839 /DNA_START=227 /DNA_END=1579 /DNA_ORIENTATION=-